MDSGGLLLRVVNHSRNTVIGDRIKTASSFAARLKGLQFAGPLDSGEGLWLVPAGSIHTFFMRYPLDLLFLGPDGEVVAARACIRPWRVALGAAGAHSCLELPAGRIMETGTHVGDRLRWESATIAREL